MNLEGELDPGLPFVRWINPTALDRAAKALQDRLKSIGEGGLVGFDGGKIYRFLELYVTAARAIKAPIETNTEEYLRNLSQYYPGKKLQEQLVPMVSQLIVLIRTRQVPSSVARPWKVDVDKGGLASDLSFSSTTNKLLIAGAIVATAYLTMPIFLKELRTR